jgi:hypothetical protein
MERGDSSGRCISPTAGSHSNLFGPRVSALCISSPSIVYRHVFTSTHRLAKSDTPLSALTPSQQRAEIAFEEFVERNGGYYRKHRLFSNEFTATQRRLRCSSRHRGRRNPGIRGPVSVLGRWQVILWHTDFLLLKSGGTKSGDGCT